MIAAFVVGDIEATCGCGVADDMNGESVAGFNVSGNRNVELAGLILVGGDVDYFPALVVLSAFGNSRSVGIFFGGINEQICEVGYSETFNISESYAGSNISARLRSGEDEAVGRIVDHAVGNGESVIIRAGEVIVPLAVVGDEDSRGISAGNGADNMYRHQVAGLTGLGKVNIEVAVHILVRRDIDYSPALVLFLALGGDFDFLFGSADALAGLFVVGALFFYSQSAVGISCLMSAVLVIDIGDLFVGVVVLGFAESANAVFISVLGGFDQSAVGISCSVGAVLFVDIGDLFVGMVVLGFAESANAVFISVLGGFD